MTDKYVIGLGVLAATAVGASLSANAAGAGASARAHMNMQAKPLVETVALSPKAIRRSLRRRGYHSIQFIDRDLPVYKVRACKNGKRFRLRMNRWGDIGKRVRIGSCGGGGIYGSPIIRGLSLPQIRNRLRNKGYYRIVFTDRQLPRYRARACKNSKRFVLVLNRLGHIVDRDHVGRCVNVRRYIPPGYGRRYVPPSVYYGRRSNPIGGPFKRPH